MIHGVSEGNKEPTDTSARGGKGGRPKGSPNKTTILARVAIANFVDGNAGRLQGWLDEIAADERHGPKVAFDAVLSLLEYHVPKLARTEHVGDGGGPVRIIASQHDEAI